MDRDEVFSFTASCFNGQPASCTYACPFRLDLRSFLKKAARGRWGAAAKEFSGAVLFPAVACALCPRPCEGACQRCTVLGEEPLSIGMIEQACLSHTAKKERASYIAPLRAERVAVVGAGAAGLSCALLLSQKRFGVTVFEKNEGWGGSLRPHPSFAQFEADFARRFDDADVEFRFGIEVDNLDELSGYDAVFLATGKGGDAFGPAGEPDHTLFTTADPRIFLGGEAAGLSFIEGMAGAARAARAIEAFLQSGSPAHAADDWNRSLCTRYAPHDSVAPMPHIVPAGAEYTPEEAAAEAARCMGCDCERCMDACELLIQYKKKPPRIAGDVFQDGQGRNSVSSASITRQTWSCNLCGRCASKCPVGADPGGLFAYSRADRVAGGAYPPGIHDYWLREMAFFAGEGSLAAPPPGRDTCEYAFFPGCRLGAGSPERMTRTLAFLRKKVDAGILLNCCGAPALWAGDMAGFRAHLEALRAAWEGLGRPTLILACPSCGRMLAENLPEIPLTYVYGILDTEDAKPPFEAAAVFDPCAAGDDPALRESVRSLAASAGIAVADWDNAGECCGFGGHMQLANPKLYGEIIHNRAVERAEPYIVYCTNCREVFASQGKPCAHILDIAFGLEAPAVPTLDEKRRNALAVKDALSKEFLNEPFTPAGQPWGALDVTLAPGLQEKMERNLISLEDVKQTLWQAEESGEGFLRPDGSILCSLPGSAVTFWVLYRENGGQYQVEDAYSHRIHVRKED